MVFRALSALRSRRRRLAGLLALTVYVVLMAVGPVLCEDECCLKSPAHCPVCMANPLAVRVDLGTALVAPPLLAAGEAPRRGGQREDTTPAGPTSGRSPPA